MAVEHAWTIIFALLGLMMAGFGLYHLWALPEHAATLARAGARCAASADTLWDVIGRVLQEARHLARDPVHHPVPRRRRADPDDRPAVPARGARGRRPGPDDRPGGHRLRHGRHGRVHRRQHLRRLLHVVAGLEARDALPDPRDEPAEPGLLLPQHRDAEPTSTLIAAALSVEMFGYGFGFVGVILYIMQVVAAGKYRPRTTRSAPASCSSASCCSR